MILWYQLLSLFFISIRLIIYFWSLIYLFCVIRLSNFFIWVFELFLMHSWRRIIFLEWRFLCTLLLCNKLTFYLLRLKLDIDIDVLHFWFRYWNWFVFAFHKFFEQLCILYWLHIDWVAHSRNLNNYSYM